MMWNPFPPSDASRVIIGDDDPLPEGQDEVEPRPENRVEARLGYGSKQESDIMHYAEVLRLEEDYREICNHYGRIEMITDRRLL